MNNIEKELNNFKQALLQINGAVGRIGEGGEDLIEITIPKSEFTYIKLALESDKNSSAYKFYKPVDDTSFKLAGCLVRYR